MAETAVVLDEQDRLTGYGDLRFTYSANGEVDTKEDVGSGESWDYDYDVMGNLKRAALPSGTVVEYVSDGRNRRVGKKVNGTLVQGLLYGDQLNPVAELDGTSAVVSRFVYGSRGHVPDYMVKGEVTYRLVSDYLGSVVAVVDVATGAIAQRMEYDSWGRVLTDTNPGFQPFGYAGGIYDQDTGLVRFGARDYDPEVGRWMSKEPLGFAGALNFYGYVDGDPINLIDPTGEAPADGWWGPAADFAAGVGDELSLGLTARIRSWIGIDDVVNICSNAYRAGEWTGFGVGLFNASRAVARLSVNFGKLPASAIFGDLSGTWKAWAGGGGELLASWWAGRAAFGSFWKGLTGVAGAFSVGSRVGRGGQPVAGGGLLAP